MRTSTPSAPSRLPTWLQLLLAITVAFSPGTVIRAQLPGTGSTTNARFLPFPAVLPPGSPLGSAISGSWTDASVEDVLRAIADAAALRLAYGEDVLRSSQRVSLRANGMSAADALLAVARDAGLAPLVSADHRTVMFVRSVAFTGKVVDAVTNSDVSDAIVHLGGTRYTARTDLRGAFRFLAVPPGAYRLVVQRIGYVAADSSLAITAEAPVHIVKYLTPVEQILSKIVVTASGRADRADQVLRPVSVLDRTALDAALGSTVTATIAGEPGIAQRFNGPAAAQPIIRGLGGDRVLVLEDGQRTGDIAGTAADHAVTIEPLTAERIEIVRGPAGLLYGSNVMGGVINVVRDEVPRAKPARPRGVVTLQGESVNSGIAGGIMTAIPAGSFSVRAEGTMRLSDDVRTPLGELPGTEMRTHNASVGVSRVTSSGYAGVAVRDYDSRYGVPGTFAGRTIPGAHAGGVYIELRRTQLRAEGERTVTVGPWRSVRGEGSYTRFKQDEIERDGAIGTQFGQLTGAGTFTARYSRSRWGGAEGVVGVWILGRDFSAAGSFTGSRPARQLGGALYLFEETRLSRFRVQWGIRHDQLRIVPLDSSPSRLLLDVHTRHFGGTTGSAALLADIGRGLTLGVSASRAFRNPSIEELYSNGPHLANYAYEIGNPTLGAERGLGTDVFMRWTHRRTDGEAAVFFNRVDGFIQYAPTGVLDPRFRRYPVYQAQQSDVHFLGAELRARLRMTSALSLSGRASYVQGSRRDDDQPLPAMPPLQGSADLVQERESYVVGIGIEGAAAQSRFGEFESYTDRYVVANGRIGIRRQFGGRQHALTLVIRNATDVGWQDHLSRVRAVAPQPGRNFQLVYRASL